MTVEMELIGATCTSCVLGIEHLGRRLKGVEDIIVDRRNGAIRLEFDGNPKTVDAIIHFVDAIGYEAKRPADYPATTC